jgi:hypothetical protein
MAAIKDAKLNGAELIRELAKTGTADAKLALARHVLGFVHRKEKRVARADEIIDAMEKAGRIEPFLDHPTTPPLTLTKAVALATTGKWAGPVEVFEPTVEDLILAGETLPEPAERPAAEQAVSEPAAEPYTMKDSLALKPVPKAKPGAKKPAPADPVTA